MNQRFGCNENKYIDYPICLTSDTNGNRFYSVVLSLWFVRLSHFRWHTSLTNREKQIWVPSSSGHIDKILSYNGTCRTCLSDTTISLRCLLTWVKQTEICIGEKQNNDDNSISFQSTIQKMVSAIGLIEWSQWKYILPFSIISLTYGNYRLEPRSLNPFIQIVNFNYSN